MSRIVHDIRQAFLKVKEVRNQLISHLMLVSISLIALWPIIASPYSADDTFDSFTPFRLRYLGKNPIELIVEVTELWKTNEGRFFPVSVSLGAYIHYLFDSRSSYKVVQLIVVIASLFVFLLFVRKLTKNIFAGLLTSLIALCSMQFKVQYDPILQFSVQQPFLLIVIGLSFTSFISAVRGNSIKLFIVSASLFLVALLTYETAVLLWPIFVMILFLESPERWRLKLLGTTIAPTAVVLHLMYLRSNVVSTASGYTSNFELVPLSRTFVKQLVASVPMSFAEVNTPTFLVDFPHQFQTGNALLWIAIVMSIGLSAWMGVLIPVQTLRFRMSLIGIGMTLWIMPALVIAQTVRWQDEIVLGNGYITAYQGYFGFALVALGVFLQLKSMLLEHRVIYTTVLITSLALVIGVCISSVVVNNPRVVAQYNPGYLWPREHFERAISAGVFAEAQENETIFSSQREWWFNAPFIEWFGGPHLKEVVAPKEEVPYGSCMMDVPTCVERLNITYAFNTFGGSPNETRVTVVGRLQVLKGNSQGITTVLVNYPNFYVEYPTESAGLKEGEDRCRSWLTQRLTQAGQNASVDQVQVTSADSTSCRASLNTPEQFDLLRFTP